MKILKEAQDNARMQELKQAMIDAEAEWNAAKKELRDFRFDLVNRGFMKHDPAPNTYQEWVIIKKLSQADENKLKNLKAKETAVWEDYLAAVDNVRNPEKEAEKAKRTDAMFRRASKYGVAPENAQKFENLKRDISEAKRNRDYHERMFNKAKEDLEKALDEMKSLAPDWTPNWG